MLGYWNHIGSRYSVTSSPDRLRRATSIQGMIRVPKGIPERRLTISDFSRKVVGPPWWMDIRYSMAISRMQTQYSRGLMILRYSRISSAVRVSSTISSISRSSSLLSNP